MNFFVSIEQERKEVNHQEKSYSSLALLLTKSLLIDGKIKLYIKMLIMKHIHTNHRFELFSSLRYLRLR